MQVGGVVKDAPDVSTQPRSALAESKQLLLEYPTGVEGALAASSSSAHEELIDVQEHEAVADAIPEVEISRFASIVIDDEEFVFLHDIEKACSLRMDECLSLLKTLSASISIAVAMAASYLARATLMLHLSPIFTLLTLLCISTLQASSVLRFEHPTFNTGNLSDINFVKQDPSWYHGQDESHIDNAIWLNPNPNEVQTRKASNLGRIIYKDPVKFTAGMSFVTSFSFQIMTTASYAFCGSGFSFLISASKQAPTQSGARYLGLVNPNARNENEVSDVFAIEFDTHVSEGLNDPSASHIGIDINFVVSLAYADSSPGSSFYPRLLLYNNYTFTAWIGYNASLNLIQVWMTNSTSTSSASVTSRPDPELLILRFSHILSSVFKDQLMYIGFSATNNASDDGMQGAALNSWSFTNEGAEKGSKSQGIPMLVSRVVLPILAVALLVIVPPLIPDHIRKYTHEELRMAREQFSETNKVGEGAFSVVYKGTHDGSLIAVKKLKQGIRIKEEFSREIKTIGACRHCNLLQLQGWCYQEEGEAMFVYRFMERGSFDQYLYDEKKEVLDSQKRLTILLDVASALNYLHTELETCVLHRDVKPANILLADNFTAMLADFDPTNSNDVSPNGSLKVDNDLHSFLNEHDELFIDDILSELPPKRGDDDHRTDLIPGSFPPKNPSYRVSQAQLEEIMSQVNELVQKGMVKKERHSQKDNSFDSNTSNESFEVEKTSNNTFELEEEEDKKKKKNSSSSKKIDEMSKRISEISSLRGVTRKVERWCTKCKSKNHTSKDCTQCNYCKTFGHVWNNFKIKMHHLKEGKDLSMIAYASMEAVLVGTEQPQSTASTSGGYNGHGRRRGRGSTGEFKRNLNCYKCYKYGVEKFAI
ncbi:hypothetical protein L7F22_049129 [Adiantum nelumboides]|nr:hypothetical protein [Adiantum nelumboides]